MNIRQRPWRALLRHCRPGRLDLRLYGIEVKAGAPLHRWKLDRSHRELFDLLLDKNEAPEFILEPIEVLLRSDFGSAVRPARALVVHDGMQPLSLRLVTLH